MVVRADEYYHGGVRYQNCKHGLTNRDHRTTHEQSQETHDHQHTGPQNGTQIADANQASENDTSFLTRWVEQIKNQIHPSGHKHLHKKRYAKEVVPWMWASIKASPENILAYEVSSFWLAEKLGKTEQALKLLEKGIEHNPESYKLELSRTRIFFENLQNYNKALSAARKTLAKWEHKQSEKQENKLSRSELLKHQNIMTLLVESNRKLGNLNTARSRAKQALELHPNNEYFKKFLDKK